MLQHLVLRLRLELFEERVTRESHHVALSAGSAEPGRRWQLSAREENANMFVV